MEKKGRPLGQQKDDAEFAFDLTPDITGGGHSEMHKRRSSVLDKSNACRNRTDGKTQPGRKDREA